MVGLLQLSEDEADDKTSQRDRQTHEPSSPEHIGIVKLTLQDAQTLSLELQYLTGAKLVVADVVVHVASVKLYSHPCCQRRNYCELLTCFDTKTAKNVQRLQYSESTWRRADRQSKHR